MSGSDARLLNTVRSEIVLLEERFRLAELGPDPHFFESILSEDAALISEEAKSFSKSNFVDAHRPGRYPRYTRVDISDLKIMDSGAGVVVTCKGSYEGPDFSGTLKFMRAWIKRNNRWQIVASAIVR